MIETVFIIGAGASRSAGAPLTATFFDAARKLQPRIRDAATAKAFGLVFKGISQLQVVHSKSDLDLDNLESVFGAFEMARLFRAPIGELTVEEIDGLGDAMRTLIVHTLEETLDFPLKEDKVPSGGFYSRLVRTIQAPAPYGQFVDAIIGKGRSAIITFNYDFAIDYAITRKGFGIAYHLNENESSDGIPVLKLHGSLNWGACSVCHQSRTFELDAAYSEQDEDPYRYRIMPQVFGNMSCCGGGNVTGPMIVPPTWSKGEHHQKIATVWAAAAKYLAQARNIVVIGYSLPASDMFFRFLYALGTIGQHPLNKFLVIDPNVEVANSFKNQLGTGAKRRFDSISAGFETQGTITTIANIVNA